MFINFLGLFLGGLIFGKLRYQKYNSSKNSKNKNSIRNTKSIRYKIHSISLRIKWNDPCLFTYFEFFLVETETIERYWGIVPTVVVELKRKIPMHCSLFIRCVKYKRIKAGLMYEIHKIPMCNSPFMRYAGDAGELEAFSCAVGDLYSNTEWVTLSKSGHEWKWI